MKQRKQAFYRPKRKQQTKSKRNKDIILLFFGKILLESKAFVNAKSFVPDLLSFHPPFRELVTFSEKEKKNPLLSSNAITINHLQNLGEQTSNSSREKESRLKK